MKLHLNTTQGQNAITGHGEGYIAVNHQQIHHAVIVLPSAPVVRWQIADSSNDTAALKLADFESLLALNQELIVFGSGNTFCFPEPAILAAFAMAKIGFEVMDTPAACRTYNVLMSEGRNVAAALLV